MIITYITHTKKTLRIKNLRNFKNSKYISKTQIFKKLLPHVNACNVHDI
jgi:hypothetical protein